jgi:hypothetical protein
MMSASIEKPVCSYGEKCFRKNKDHIENYEHPEKPAKRQRTDPKSTSKAKDKAKTNEMFTKPLPEGPKLPMEIIDLKQIEGECLTDQYVISSLFTCYRFFLDIKSLIFENQKMQMPDDFYDFLDFCKSLKPDDPKSRLATVVLF